jgi:VCBS repeat-containing protein
MWRIRRLAIPPVLALLVTAMAAISIPSANADTLADSGRHACAIDQNGQLRYAAGECGYQGASAARRPRHHQPPVLANVESAALQVTAGAAAARVTASVTVASPATATLTGATVSVSSGFAAGQDSLGFTGQSGITGSYNAKSGALTLTGQAPTASYQAALRSVTYRDPAAAPPGPRTISFQVSDAEQGHAVSNIVSRTVQVARPKPPVAAGDTATTGKNTPVTINVLANDTDPAGLPLTIASVNTTGTKGAVTINPGAKTVTYNPNGKFAGLTAGQTATDTFTYKATDGTQTSGPATVTVTITGSGTAAQPPTVTSHTYTAVGNTPLGVGTTPAAPAATVSGTVLSGDTDPDPTVTLTVTATTQPAHGTVTVNPNGTFTYLPNPGYSGTDTFKCAIAGSNAPTVTATETITVTVGTVVWYVNNNLTAAGNGEAGSPFSTLAAADTAAGADSIIFLYAGNAAYNGGAVMHTGEDLWGQPHGLTVSGHALVPAGGSTPGITNSGAGGDGNDIDLADGADVEGVNVTGLDDNGIVAQNVTDATVGATTRVAVSVTYGTGISVAGGDGDLNFGDTSVTGGAGSAVGVGGRTGGTVTFGGPITGNGGGPYAGVFLAGNAGATIAFTGTLTLTTFKAGGTDPADEGGTVTATGAGSTISAQLAVQNTTIGAAGLTFQSISYNVLDLGTTGMDLDNTGSAGSLTVTGTGTPGSGGTIKGWAFAREGMANIQLNQTYAPSLTDMAIENISGGIDVDDVNGLTLTDCTLSNTPVEFASGAGGAALTGTVSITNSTIQGDGAFGFGITDDSGTLNLTVTGTTFNGAWLGVAADGSATATVSVTGSTFTGTDASFGFTADPAATGTDSVTFSGNTVNPGDADITADGGDVCAAITDTTGTGGINLAQNDTSTIKLPGYTGSPEDTSAVVSFLESRNSVPATATVSGSGGGFTGGSGC